MAHDVATLGATAAVDRPHPRAWLTPSRVVAAAVVVLGAAGVVRIAGGWTPIGDHALMRLWVDAVGGNHTPLVGGDSRYGWNHLGPWLFYLLAGPYRLVGGAGGLLLGAAVINLAALVLVVRAGRAAAGDAAGVVMGAGVCVFLALAGPVRLVDPWNPTVVLVVFAASVVGCWAVTMGRLSWAPVVVGGSSLCVQAHIAFAPPAVVLVAIAMVVLGHAAWRRAPGWGRPVAASTVVAVLAWLPAALDMGPGGTHNLTRVWHFAGGGTSASRAGLALGVRAVLRETGLQARWLGGRAPLDHFTHGFRGAMGLAPGAGIAALAIVAWAAWRRRDVATLRLCALLGTLLLAAVVAVASTVGDLYPYLFAWVGVVGMLCWASVAVLLVRAWHGRQSEWLPVGALAACASLALVATLSGPLPRSPREVAGDAARVRRLALAVAAHLSPAEHYRTVVGGDAYNSVFQHGVVSELTDRGYHIEATPDLAFLYGTAVASATASQDPVVEVVAPYRGERTAPDVIAIDDPLSAADRATEIELTQRLAAAYRDSGHADAATIVERSDDTMILLAGFVAPGVAPDADLQHLVRLRAAGPAVAVTLDPPG